MDTANKIVNLNEWKKKRLEQIHCICGWQGTSLIEVKMPPDFIFEQLVCPACHENSGLTFSEKTLAKYGIIPTTSDQDAPK
tara:strand:- start:538 stop:780 length:243 start_codon:yes stop_codon:yes gene_type:complete